MKVKRNKTIREGATQICIFSMHNYEGISQGIDEVLYISTLSQSRLERSVTLELEQKACRKTTRNDDALQTTWMPTALNNQLSPHSLVPNWNTTQQLSFCGWRSARATSHCLPPERERARMFVVSAVIMKFEIDPFSIVLAALLRPTARWGHFVSVGRAGGGGRPIIQQFIIYLQRPSERAASGQTPLGDKIWPSGQNYAADSHHAACKSGENRALGIY